MNKTKPSVTLTTLLLLISIFSLALVLIPVMADPDIIINGVIDPGEWDAYYLGTSVTGWQGGMSIDVYGFADDTYLYAAYVADTSQPGWVDAVNMWVECNFIYRTPQTASWPDLGYTMFQMWDDPPSYVYTDGADWEWPSSGYLNDVLGLEYAYVKHGEPGGSTGVAEFKIPLSLLTYAGADDKIRLSGQYWQYDWAVPFYVDVAPPIPTILEAVVDIGENVDHDGVVNSLTSKLQNALKALTKGNMEAFENILNAFINEVEAQSSKKISTEYAATLIEWALAWIGDPGIAM